MERMKEKLPEGATHVLVREDGSQRSTRFGKRGKNGQWVVWTGSRWEGAYSDFKFWTDVLPINKLGE